jgi:hypothetical protein
MSKILVFNVPAHGHVNPTLPVVRELVSRGEQVAYYLTDEFEPQIRHTGAEFRRTDDIQMGSGSPPGVTAMGQTDPEKVRQMMAAFFPRMMADGLPLVLGLFDRVRDERTPTALSTILFARGVEPSPGSWACPRWHSYPATR